MKNERLSLETAIIGIGFVVVGVQHFRKPKFFEKIVPDWVKNAGISAKNANIISGSAEIAGGLGMLLPCSRPAARLGLLALLGAVFPANIEMAINSHKYKRYPRTLLWARLPLQGVIAWAVWRAGR